MAEMYLDSELKDLTMEQVAEINKNSNCNTKWQSSKPTEPMIPREYQYEILKKAVSENIIAVLDTGAGKTLISVMLIKHMKMIEDENSSTIPHYERKITFFLVERVPLVFQQFNVLESNCDARIEKLCGEMNVDTWSKQKWLDIFDSSDICIMTAQILRDVLKRGFLSLDRVNLLIFDECHHTTKGHPYNLIMYEFYHRMEGPRPKIFGMTASPANKANVIKSIVIHIFSTLEKNLDAKVYTAIQTQELSDVVNKPTETILCYSMTVIDDLPDQRTPALIIKSRYPRTELTTVLSQKLKGVNGFDQCLKFNTVISNNLGQWCSDRLWQDILDNPWFQTRDDSSRSDNNMVYARRYSSEEIELLKEARELCNKTSTEPDLNNDHLFTPKIKELINCLTVIHKQEAFHGIIFVERRQTAKAIKVLIESLSVFKDSVRCDILVGHGGLNNAPGSVNMKLGGQHSIIQRFRTGELNLIVATSVAEEGLDIQACNYVICFDLFKTPAAYIQSRGRARRREARYILMVNKQNQKETELISHFQRVENDMKEFCRALPEERNVARLFDQEYDPDFIKKKEAEKHLKDAYVIPSTGAILTLRSAIALVYDYCMSLPSDAFCNFKPVYKTGVHELTGFYCTLTLPINSEKRLFEAYAGSKAEAKMAVSLEACINLHELGAIDDNLIPVNKIIKKRLEEERDKEGKQIGSRKRENIYPKKIPSFWKSPADATTTLLGPYWITYIEIANDCKFRKMCLITRLRLPPIEDIQLVDNTQGVVVVKFYRLKTQLMFQKKEQVERLSNYLIAITRAVTNKEFICSVEDTPYLLAPLKSSGSFDWAEIKSTINNKNIPIDMSRLQDTVALDQSGKYYFVDSVKDDMSPNSFMKDDEKTSFAQYFKTKDIEIQDLQQPLLSAIRINKSEEKSGTSSEISLLVPELCHIYSISASVFRVLHVFPVITAHIDATLLSLEAKKSLNVHHINTTLMIEAYTASSAGIKINYQRLEFLGGN
ncbi:hypothetical protein HPULCUR_010539 [Helicostylum pulchrum]|uniref:Uncharacterized protein n=1 Tax=Helicostylum pulchrum TaxID=562976 RepID=A0ABP9YDN3_9FUNG